MKISKKPATNEKEVHKLESELNIKFTEEYFQFLLRYNGGVTEKKVFKAGEFGRSIIHGFHGVLPSDPIWDIKSVYNVYENRIPKEFISIGRDMLGNHILLGVKEKYNGKVYVWSHEDESDTEEPNYTNIYKISNTFNDFVNSLSEYQEEKKGNWEDLFKEENYSEIKKLIASGWDVNSPLSLGNKPISSMIMRNNFEIVKLLIDNGADLTDVAHNAVLNNLPKMLEFLLASGVNPNERNNMNNPLLYQAIMQKRVECVSVLLKYNADKTLINNGGFTAYTLAEKIKSRGQKGIDEIIELLNADN